MESTQDKLNRLVADAKTGQDLSAGLSTLAQDIQDDPTTVDPGNPATHEDIQAVKDQLSTLKDAIDKLTAAIPAPADGGGTPPDGGTPEP